jgi:hypothetical protein
MLHNNLGRLAALAAVAVLSGCDSGPEIVPASWASQPSAADLAQAYPAFARMAHIPGKVKLRCDYTVSGVLERCRKLGVAPEGLNFDQSIPRLLAKYIVKPQTYDGTVAPAPIEFVIAFNPPSAPPASSSPPPTDAEMAALRRGVSLTGAMESQIAQLQATRSVEVDRMNVVADIVNRAHDAETTDRVDSVLQGVIQAMTPAQRQELLTNPRFMVLPNRLEIEAASPVYFAYSQRLATRMRTEYCAKYSCDATLPNAAPASE